MSISTRKQAWMKQMQVFARALIVPVLLLPFVGIFLALSSVFGMIAPIGSLLSSVGILLGGAFWPILLNLSLIFCVALAMGLAREKKPEAAFTAVVVYLLFLGLNHTWLSLTGAHVSYTQTSELYGTGQTLILGFQVLDMGVFLGMLLGVMVAWVHNRYVHTVFPGAFAFYGDSKFVFFLLVPLTFFLNIVVSFLWPFVASFLALLTSLIDRSGVFGVFLYGFLERFLIPTGLHHLIWAPFLYSDLGGVFFKDGEAVAGAFPIFLSQLSDPGVTQLHGSVKFLQYGMVKVYGLTGVALAFYRTALINQKQAVRALILPAWLTSILVGITEPLEFTFIFISPLLWLIYSVLSGAFQALTVALGVTALGHNGFIDFFVYNLPMGIALTRWPFYIVIGLIQVVVFYAVFRFVILKKNLATPGRLVEDGQESSSFLSQSRKQFSSNQEQIVLLVKALGGKQNIISVDACFTRLRVELRDASLLDEVLAQAAGSRAVFRQEDHVQLIFGLEVSTLLQDLEHFLREV